MAGPTAEKHADRLDRLEQTLELGLAALDRVIQALENENHSGARVAHIHDARLYFEEAVKAWPAFKKD